MGIFKRVGDLFSANLNDLLDQCENPEKMLRQAVREMEAALGKSLDGAARAIAHERLLSRQLADAQREIDRRRHLAEAAVQRGDDQAARRELGYKAQHQQLAEGLSEQIGTAATLSHRLRNQVSTMRIKLAEARHKLLEVTARNQAAQARRKFVANLSTEINGAILSNFERMCARVEQAEAETEALFELLGESDGEPSLDAEIEAELEALKEKMPHAAP